MKTCGYCGRENEDSAIVCRECGLSEFSDAAAEQTRAAKSPKIIEPEPELPESDVASGEEACICPFCLFPNLPEREWCKNCGAPFNTSIMGPFENALGEGFVWRGAVRGRPKPIVLAAVWLLCFPAAVVSVIALCWGGSAEGPVFRISAAFYGIVFTSITYKVTKNFLTIPKPKLDD